MEIGAAVKANSDVYPLVCEMAQSPRPLHCLIVINLLESHYLGPLITGDCDSEAVRAICILETSQEILYIYSLQCKKTKKGHFLFVLYKILYISPGVSCTQL